MTHLKRLRLRLAAALAVPALAVAVASPASASYSSGQCWPSGLTSTNRLSVTVWTVYGSTGIAYRRYHMDENSQSGWNNYAIWVGSVKMSGTNDVYYTAYNVAHTVKGEWRKYGADTYWSATCSLYI